MWKTLLGVNKLQINFLLDQSDGKKEHVGLKKHERGLGQVDDLSDLCSTFPRARFINLIG